MRRKLNRTEETSQIDWYNAKGIPKAEAKTLLYIDTMATITKRHWFSFGLCVLRGLHLHCADVKCQLYTLYLDPADTFGLGNADFEQTNDQYSIYIYSEP